MESHIQPQMDPRTPKKAKGTGEKDRASRKRIRKKGSTPGGVKKSRETERDTENENVRHIFVPFDNTEETVKKEGRCV